MCKEAIAVAGAGRLAQALAKLLYDRGEPVVAVASRRPERARAAAAFIGSGVAPAEYKELASRAARVLIAVPDDAVASVAAALAQGGMRRGAALHTCGVYGVEVLDPLGAQGVSCGTLHPLQTISTPEQGAASLPGSAFAAGGQGAALAWAERIVSLLQGECLRVRPGCKPIYHAAAVTASNYIVALIDAAVALMEAAGIAPEQALRALAPLVRASTENALTLGAARALTGPIQRGDIETVNLHLKALGAAPLPAVVLQLYRAAGMQALQLAGRGGLPAPLAAQLEELLKGDSPYGERGKARSGS